jgi:hypothetical protein
MSGEETTGIGGFARENANEAEGTDVEEAPEFDDLDVEDPTIEDVLTFVDRQTNAEMESLFGDTDEQPPKHGIHLAQARLGDLSKDLARAEVVEADPTSEVQDEIIEEALTGKLVNLLLGVMTIAADHDLDVSEALSYRMELTEAMNDGDKEAIAELIGDSPTRMAEPRHPAPGEDVSSHEADDIGYQ